MRRDILSAYLASGARVLSWVVISAVVYRRSAEGFAMLALVQGTIGILEYVSLGLLPAMIKAFAHAAPSTAIIDKPSVPDTLPACPATISYATSQTNNQDVRRRRFLDDFTNKVYSAGFRIALVTSTIGIVATLIFATHPGALYAISTPRNRSSTTDSATELGFLIACFGIGAVFRWFSDIEGALLQTRGRIALDNLLLAAGEAVCVISFLVLYSILTPSAWSAVSPRAAAAYPLSFVTPIHAAGLGVLIGSGALLWLRMGASSFCCGRRILSNVDATLLRPLLITGVLITLAQLADYLYSPTDYLLINHLLTPLDLTHYAPAIQIDSGLLLLVTGLGAVLLPKTAIAHAAGHRESVRNYYIRGTLASAGLLIVASGLIYLAAPLIFRIWLGNPMTGTVAILPLVLLNTVIGGSSAVGRSILIGIGKTRPFVLSVLIAGIINVVFSILFVHFGHMGLNGIILGTVVAVVARCAVWMPWYVLRVLHREFLSPLPARLAGDA